MIVSTPAADSKRRLDGLRHCNQGFEEGLLNMWRQMRDEGKITNVGRERTFVYYSK